MSYTGIDQMSLSGSHSRYGPRRHHSSKHQAAQQTTSGSQVALSMGSGELRVCVLCYHPSDTVMLQCGHTVCISCAHNKLSHITPPPQLQGKLFCPICGYFVGRCIEMVTATTQTWPPSLCAEEESLSRSRSSTMSLSNDSGYEDLSSPLESPQVTSTPNVKSMTSPWEQQNRVNKPLFDIPIDGQSIDLSIQESLPNLSIADTSSQYDSDSQSDDLQTSDNADKQQILPTVNDASEAVFLAEGQTMQYSMKEEKLYKHTNCSKQSSTSKPKHSSLQNEDTGVDKSARKKAHQKRSKPACKVHTHCISKYFCKDCVHHICLACKISEHKHHQVIPIKALDRLQIDATETTFPSDNVTAEDAIEDAVFPEITEDHVLDLQSWIDELENYITVLHKKKQSAMKRLDSRRNYLRHFVERWYGKMSLQIETLFAQEINSIEQTLTDIKSSFNQYENAASAHTASDVVLSHMSPANLGSLTEDLTVVLSFGVGLTYNMLGTFSASYLKSEKEESPVCPVSNFEESFRADASFNNTEFQTYSPPSSTLSSNGQPPLNYLPRPSINIISHGQEVRSFETRAKDSNCQYMATGLSLTNDGSVMVSDIGTDSVKVFSTAGRFLFDVATLPADEATKAIQLDNNDIAVATKSCIKLFCDSGYFKRKTASAIECPQSMVMAPNGNILITDHIEDDLHLIVTYRPDLQTPVHVFNSTSQKEVSHQFTMPWYIATNTANDIYVSDRVEHCIKVYSRRGQFRWSAGGQGAGPGQLFQPAGIVIDRYGHVVVADSGNDRVQVFSPQGDWLGTIVDGEQHGIHTPMDLAINSAGNLVLLQADGKVRIFTYML